MNQALVLILDTLRQQTNLLREIADTVKDEPGPSPAIQRLDELTEAAMSMGAGIEALGVKLDRLPDAIGVAMEGAAATPEAGMVGGGVTSADLSDRGCGSAARGVQHGRAPFAADPLGE